MKRMVCLLLLAACGGKSGPEKTAPAGGPVTAAPALRPIDRTLHPLSVNGTRLTYRLNGDSGATVVFIHGTFGDLNTWRGQETLFAQRYRVLVYSRRYHPPNPPVEDNETYSPKLHAEDLAALLLTLDIAPAHIIGSSYGAYVALELARDHPELVRSLVLAEPPMFPLLSGSELGDSVRRAFYTNSLDPARRALAHGDSVAGIRMFYDGLSGGFGRFDHLPGPVRADLVAHAFEFRREMLANREQYLPTVSCAELGRVATPTLLLRGDRSPRAFQLISDELARCMQSDTMVTIPGAGHPVHTANPGYYNQVVLRFLMTH
ncbi:MAG TPA: alpha/beta hydrolase [Gemmatimonadales bacterium]|nr:alpha/beta hydrolase [Gemmatimonadales bacterium]